MTLEELISRGLSFDKLRTFLAVVRNGSVMSAAKGDNSRRSLMSRQLNELERTLGFELFSRAGKKLVLTDAGRQIALIALSFAEELNSVTSEIAGGPRLLRLGAGASSLETFVFPRLPSLPKDFHGLRFDFQSDSTASLLRDLQEGNLSMAIVRTNAITKSHLSFPIGRMDFTLVARRDLARGVETWSADQVVENAPMAMIRGAGSLVAKFLEIFDERGKMPTIQYQVDTFGQVKELLIAGCPAGLLPISMAKGLSREVFVFFDSEFLRVLSRDFALIIDKRAAKTRDSLAPLAERLALAIS